MNRNILFVVCIGILVLFLGALYFFMGSGRPSQSDSSANVDEDDFSLRFSEVGSDNVPVISEQKLSEFRKKSDRQVRDIISEMDHEIATEHARDIDSFLASIRLEPITDADKIEIQNMLAKIGNVEGKSDAYIINAMLDFFPDQYRFAGMSDLFTNFYKDLGLDADQKVIALAHFAQSQLSRLRSIDAGVLEKSLSVVDATGSHPDAYFDVAIEKMYSDIPETERLMREAELRGDTGSVEFHRNHLNALYGRIDDLNSAKNFEEHIQARIEAILADKLPNIQSDYKEWVKELVDDFEKDKSSVSTIDLNKPMLNDTKNAVIEKPESPFNSVLLDLGDRYFDVVISRYLTPKELEKYYPTSDDRNVLSIRTKALQKSLVSEMRSVLGGMNNKTDIEKRKLASDFLNTHYDKEFAADVIELLYGASE